VAESIPYPSGITRLLSLLKFPSQVVRPAVSNGLGIHGSLRDGPWTYRVCSLVIMSPIYGVLLVVVGTTFGRHAYFR
jgi:hypothetical protein